MCALRFPSFDFVTSIPDEQNVNELAAQVVSDTMNEEKEYIEYLKECNADETAQLLKDAEWEANHLTPMY